MYHNSHKFNPHPAAHAYMPAKLINIIYLLLVNTTESSDEGTDFELCPTVPPIYYLS